MSALQDILTNHQTLTYDVINKTLPIIVSETGELKQRFGKYVEDTFVKYTNRSQKISKLRVETNILTERASKLKNNVDHYLKEDIVNKKKLVTSYENDLEEIGAHLNICARFCTIHENLEKLNKLKQNEEYCTFMAVLEEVEELIAGCGGDENNHVLSVLFDKARNQKETMLLLLYNIVTTNIKYKNENGEYSIVVKEHNSEMQNALKALKDESSNFFLPGFVLFIWNVLMKIVQETTQITCVNSQQSHNFTLLSLTNKKASFPVVMASLMKFLGYLHETLNYEYGDDGNMLLGHIGEDIRDNLCELLIKQCLEDTIPNNEADLPKYKEVQVKVSELQEMLRKMHIFTPTTTAILDHANNIDILFINKQSREYRVQATELMKKDLHDIVMLGQPVDPKKLPDDEFPQCAVSKSVVEILDLVLALVAKAVRSSEVCAGRLYLTALNILSEYPEKTKQFHEKLLKTIPQQIAIFYNNCMYISHEFENNEKWTRLLSEMPKIIEIDRNISERLKSQAESMFEVYLQEQITQIEATIKGSGLASLKTLEKIDQSVEKSVRQCLRQQELLKTVWMKILNYYDYNRAVGLLLNALSKAIINAVLYVEDILTEPGEQLVDIIKVVQTRGAKLFTDPKEINMYVESWAKLQELSFVLSSSLLNIEDRWASGKGPLALHFSPEEMRHLIRALFQQSDRRSSILAQIRDVDTW